MTYERRSFFFPFYFYRKKRGNLFTAVQRRVTPNVTQINATSFLGWLCAVCCVHCALTWPRTKNASLGMTYINNTHTRRTEQLQKHKQTEEKWSDTMAWKWQHFCPRCFISSLVRFAAVHSFYFVSFLFCLDTNNGNSCSIFFDVGCVHDYQLWVEQKTKTIVRPRSFRSN